ncbi:hypothetical protein GE061_006770, partial [Apolygus lucorum]
MSSVWKEEPMDPQPDQEDFPQLPDVQEEPPLQPQMDILMRPIQQLLENNSKFLEMEPLFDILVSSLAEFKLHQANINIEEDIKEASEEATTPGFKDPETRIPSSRRGWTSADLTLPENSPIK